MHRKILGPIIALLVILSGSAAFGSSGNAGDQLRNISVTATGNDSNSTWTRANEYELFNFSMGLNETVNMTYINITVPSISNENNTNFTVDFSAGYSIIGNSTAWYCSNDTFVSLGRTNVSMVNCSSQFGTGANEILYIAFQATAADMAVENWQEWNVSYYGNATTGVHANWSYSTALTGIDGVNPTASISTDREYIYQRQTITPTCTVADSAMASLSSTYWRHSVVSPDDTRTDVGSLSGEFTETSQKGTYTIHCDAEDSVGNYVNETDTFEARSRVTNAGTWTGPSEEEEEEETGEEEEEEAGEEATTTTQPTTTTTQPSGSIIDVILSPFTWLWSMLFG